MLFTEEEIANCHAYVATIEAEEARKRAMGLPVFGDVIDKIRNDDSEFSAALGEGYLSFYDRSDPHPDTAAAMVAYLTSHEGDHSQEWNLGYACGYFAALAESEPSFFWTSSPPSTNVRRTEDGRVFATPAQQTARIVYTVLLGLDGFPVQFISAGQVGNFPGPFADPGEACQEFECCYEPGAALYLEPVEFNKRAAGLPSFLFAIGDEKRLREG